MDSFYSRDIQRLFAFRNPEKFHAFFEYLLKQSGGQFEATRAASALGIGRPTVESHLRALETTHAVTLCGPSSAGGQKEVIKMPKIYGFDTGFVASRVAGTRYVLIDYGLPLGALRPRIPQGPRLRATDSLLAAGRREGDRLCHCQKPRSRRRDRMQMEQGAFRLGGSQGFPYLLSARRQLSGVSSRHTRLFYQYSGHGGLCLQP